MLSPQRFDAGPVVQLVSGGNFSGGNACLPLSGPRIDVVTTRLDLPSASVGFIPPPCRVHLQFLPAHHGRWSVVALAATDKIRIVVNWLEREYQARTTIGPGIAPKVVRAEFDALPPAWARLVATLQLQYMDISPGGMASMFVHGTSDEVRHFLDSVPMPAGTARSRPTEHAPCPTSLTPRQHEALATAVALGYYSIPHAVDLRELAREMGISLGSVSELLRRGEGTVITGYVDSIAMAHSKSLVNIQWEMHTLARPAKPPEAIRQVATESTLTEMPAT